MNYHDEIDAIEKRYNVNVDIHDESGSTRVYRYTDEGDLSFLEIGSMNPPVGDIVLAASAVNAMRVLREKGWKGGCP